MPFVPLWASQCTNNVIRDTSEYCRQHLSCLFIVDRQVTNASRSLLLACSRESSLATMSTAPSSKQPPKTKGRFTIFDDKDAVEGSSDAGATSMRSSDDGMHKG